MIVGMTVHLVRAFLLLGVFLGILGFYWLSQPPLSV